jgi:GTP cyclohydrolase I
MTWRGVRESMDSNMTTSVVRGAIKENAAARAEFFALIRE